MKDPSAPTSCARRTLSSELNLSLNASILFFTRQKETASSNRGQSSKSSFRAWSRRDAGVVSPCSAVEPACGSPSFSRQLSRFSPLGSPLTCVGCCNPSTSRRWSSTYSASSRYLMRSPSSSAVAASALSRHHLRCTPPALPHSQGKPRLDGLSGLAGPDTRTLPRRALGQYGG